MAMRIIEFFAQRDYKALFILLLVLFSSLTVATYVIEAVGAKVSETKIETPDGVLGAYTVMPARNLDRDFVFIVIHGFSVTRTIVKPLAVDLARAGFASLVIDLYGHYTAEPVLQVPRGYKDASKTSIESIRGMIKAFPAIFKKARELVANESARIIIVGHSLGGAVAIMAGFFFEEVDVVFAIAPLPPYDYVNETRPKKLIVLIGDHDEVFSLEDEILLLKHAGWNAPSPGKNLTRGDIVRALHVLKNADHALELFVSETFEIITGWLHALYGKEVRAQPRAIVEFVLSAVLAPIIAMGLAALFPFTMKSLFRFKPRKELTSILLEPTPKGSIKRDAVFTAMYAGLWYFLIAASWGQVLISTMPTTGIRFGLAILLSFIFFVVFYIHELVRYIIGKLLSQRVSRRVFGYATLFSFIIKLAFFATLPLIALSMLFVIIGIEGQKLLFGLSKLAAIFLIPVAFMTEAAALPSLVVTERRSVPAIVNAIPWAFVSATILPLLIL